jgi:hypothetical protein
MRLSEISLVTNPPVEEEVKPVEVTGSKTVFTEVLLMICPGICALEVRDKQRNKANKVCMRKVVLIAVFKRFE